MQDFGKRDSAEFRFFEQENEFSRLGTNFHINNSFAQNHKKLKKNPENPIFAFSNKTTNFLSKKIEEKKTRFYKTEFCGISRNFTRKRRYFRKWDFGQAGF